MFGVFQIEKLSSRLDLKLDRKFSFSAFRKMGPRVEKATRIERNSEAYQHAPRSINIAADAQDWRGKHWHKLVFGPRRAANEMSAGFDDKGEG